MKTSLTQFEMLVHFMEHHGDINKPSKNAHGRIQAIKDWDRLKSLLNSDPTGKIQNTEKWKKVWSDLKNNTKKKAAKINRAVRGTGGGPALQTKLTQLEERILNIMGPQAATGLVGVVEAGFPQEPNVDSDRTITLPPTPPHIPQTESPVIFTVVPDDTEIIVPDLWDLPGSCRQPHVAPPVTSPQMAVTPPPVSISPQQVEHSPPPPATQHPANRGQTPSRRQRYKSRVIAPRRSLIDSAGPRPQSYMEQTAQMFLNSDEKWKFFLEKQHNDSIAIEKEKLRLREKELQIQQRWQDIAMHAVAALQTFSNRQ